MADVNGNSPLILNAVITAADIFADDRCILSAFVSVDMGSGGVQGFGGYELAASHNCALFIIKVMDVAGVSKWNHLIGRPIRVRKNNGQLSGSINAIGHFLDDLWFEPALEFSAL
jgi:hypothetical protein